MQIMGVENRNLLHRKRLTNPNTSLRVGFIFFMTLDITCQKCGLVNDYKVVTSGPHNSAYCNNCNAYIKHLPKENKEHVIYFGKYKGTPLKDFTTKEHVSWLQWAINNATTLKPDLRTAILKHLGL